MLQGQRFGGVHGIREISSSQTCLLPTAQARSTYCIHRRIGIVQKIPLFNPPIVCRMECCTCANHIDK